MEFLKLVSKRYSVRSFQSTPVEKEKLEKVLEAARLAPSAVNYQPWHLYVVTQKELLQKLQEAYPRNWFAQAPVVIVACGDHSQSWKRGDGKDYCDVDLAIAVDHITLAAADLGLGTCWIGAFDAKLVHEVLELPEHMEPLVMLPIGYPQAAETPKKKRKELEQLVTWINQQE